jgi:hypothetical protein
MRRVGRLVGLLGIGVLVIAAAVGCGTDSDCADDSVEQRVCVECGPAGGCAKYADQCARPCDTHADCESTDLPFGCFEGVCQVGGCI